MEEGIYCLSRSPLLMISLQHHHYSRNLPFFLIAPITGHCLITFASRTSVKRLVHMKWSVKLLIVYHYNKIGILIATTIITT